MDIREVLSSEEIFLHCKEVLIEPLNGGFSNETYLATAEGIKYVVKLNYPQNKYFGLSRKTERYAQNLAADLGIAPRVCGDLSNESYTIAEYVPGRIMTGDEVKQEENIVKVAQALKKIHSIEFPDRTCSVFDLLEGYLKGMKEFRVKEPEGLKDILIEMEHIRSKREKDKTNNNKYTHNDILDLNLVINEDKITVIDWELSGVGDPYMDLASLPYSSGFLKEQEKLLLKEYFGYYEEDMYYHLKSLKYIGLVREVLWALFYGGLHLKSVNHNMDYFGAANHALERLKQGFLSF